MKNLGFECEQLAWLFYSFEYEGLNYLITFDKDDEDYLTVSLHAGFSVKDISEDTTFRLMNITNAHMRYVKSYILLGDIYIFYEYDAQGYEDYDRLIPHMVYALEAAFVFMHEAFEKKLWLQNDDADEDALNSDNVDDGNDVDSEDDDDLEKLRQLED